LNENLPFNPYLQYFGPEYKLDVEETNMEDYNNKEYLDGIL